jgi:hypothetical protein
VMAGPTEDDCPLTWLEDDQLTESLDMATSRSFVIGDVGQDKLAVAVELRKGGRELALLAGGRIGLAPRAEGVGGGHEQIVALIGRDVGDDELASLGCWGEIGKCRRCVTTLELAGKDRVKTAISLSAL